MEASLKKQALDWVRDLKLTPALIPVIRHTRLQRLYEMWQEWRAGRPPSGVDIMDFPDGLHGRTRIRGGRVHSIEVSERDPDKRQGLTFVHEILHAQAYPTKPNHKDLHTLAAGLSHVIFPRYAEEGENMRSEDILTDDEYDAAVEVNDEEQDGDEVSTLLQDLGMDVDEDGEELDLFKKRNIFSRLIRRTPLIGRRLRRKDKKSSVIPQLRQPGLEAMATQQAFKGWIIKHIIEMYKGNSYVVPLYGIERMTPFANIGGFKAPTWGAFWSQLIQSLDAGTARTVKSQSAATVVAAVATIVNLTSRSIGHIMQFTDSLQAADQRPIRVRHFTQAGGTELEYQITLKPGGVASWIVLAIENDRGAGIVTASNDLQARINADSARPGAILTAESINYREIER